MPGTAPSGVFVFCLHLPFKKLENSDLAGVVWVNFPSEGGCRDPMRSPEPWEGLKEAAIGFVATNMILANFFWGGLLPRVVQVVSWLSVAVAAPSYFAHRFLRSRASASHHGEEEVEMKPLLDEFDEEDDTFAMETPASSGDR